MWSKEKKFHAEDISVGVTGVTAGKVSAETKVGYSKESSTATTQQKDSSAAPASTIPKPK